MIKHVEEEFRLWWNGLDSCDVMAVNALAAGEAWYQFDFGRYFRKRAWDAQCNTTIRLEVDKIDITIGTTGLEFKMLWNNKNLYKAANSIVRDIEKLKKSRNAGYAVLLWAFYNRHVSENNLKSSTFLWKTNNVHLQPNKTDDFPKFAQRLAASVVEYVGRKAITNRPAPTPMLKYSENDAWLAATLWRVL